MRVISRKKLRDFWERSGRRDAQQPFLAWFKEAENGAWESPHELLSLYPTASILKGGRVVFNIQGNKYRLVAAVRYDYPRYSNLKNAGLRPAKRSEGDPIFKCRPLAGGFEGGIGYGMVYIRFVGTHAQYDRIDAEKV